MAPAARELCLGPFLNGIADPRASLGFKFFKISVWISAFTQLAQATS